MLGNKQIFIPQSGRGLRSREDNITKFCTLLESKRPKQYRPTKFDHKSGRGLWSRDHFWNFWKNPISQERLFSSQKIMVLGQKQNLTPKMGVAYGHVTTLAISEIVTYLRGATENVGQENDGQENDGQKCRAGKCRTGKWRTKVQGWKMPDWKMTDKSARWEYRCYHQQI